MINNAQELRRMVDAVREDNAPLIASLPDSAVTTAQERLMEKHGTPREYAQAVVNAIGEISCLEAHTAIAKYKKQWEDAGTLIPRNVKDQATANER